MRTGQALFPLEIEPGIPRVRPWKELLATGAQATWLKLSIYINLPRNIIHILKDIYYGQNKKSHLLYSKDNYYGQNKTHFF